MMKKAKKNQWKDKDNSQKTEMEAKEPKAL